EALERLHDEGPDGLVDREAEPTRRAERDRRPGWQLHGALLFPAASLQVTAHRAQVFHGIQVDRAVALEMVGEQDRRWTAELDHRDANTAILDREPELGTEDVDEVPKVGGDVVARRVQVVEPAQGHRSCRL